MNLGLKGVLKRTVVEQKVLNGLEGADKAHEWVFSAW